MRNASCFENQNRLLLHIKKSLTETAIKIANSYFFYSSIPLFSSYFPVGSRVLEFSENFEYEVKNCIKVHEAVVIGAGKEYSFNENEQQLNFFGSCLSYQKFIYKHRRNATKNYVQNLKINDSVI